MRGRDIAGHCPIESAVTVARLRLGADARRRSVVKKKEKAVESVEIKR